MLLTDTVKNILMMPMCIVYVNEMYSTSSCNIKTAIIMVCAIGERKFIFVYEMRVCGTRLAFSVIPFWIASRHKPTIYI